ncbi:CD048 protein, partial [Dicaeum eximium]|nr:CD048 protein [Dicaeum eximium]
RPCVDCHAFEFMQRALQDLKRTANNLDTRTETLLLRAEKRGLCDCFRAIH